MSTVGDVSVVVVTYNGVEHLPGLFASLEAQSMLPSEIIVVDNSPDDLTEKALDVYKEKSSVPITILPQSKNLDFSAGYNLGMSKASSSYVLSCNQDMELDRDAIENLVQAAELNPRLGVAAPKLRRLFPTGSKQTDPVLDGMGVEVARNRRFTNVGEGEVDSSQYDDTTAHTPFGLSGAAMLFRRETLRDLVAHGGGKPHEYFDETFVAYKEDIDLSYRARHRGWDVQVVPTAIIYHRRTAQELKEHAGLRADRAAKSLRIRSNSFRNHYWVLFKNEPLSSLLRDLPWIVWYELRKWVYTIAVERDVLPATIGLVSKYPEMLRKRRAILTSSKISAITLRQMQSLNQKK